jgi:putative oxidoreductase
MGKNVFATAAGSQGRRPGIDSAMTATTAESPVADRSHAPSLLARLAKTDDSLAPTIARVALGAVMFPHGAQKLLGWFGGYGFSATVGFFKTVLHVPAPIAVLVILAESIGALMLILGVASRFAAASIALVMAAAVAMAHAHVGFFMNWAGTQQGEGFEYHILAIALALVVVVAGGGKASIDRKLAR